MTIEELLLPERRPTLIFDAPQPADRSGLHVAGVSMLDKFAGELDVCPVCGYPIEVGAEICAKCGEVNG